MSMKFDNIPGWIFIMDEISSGVYKVSGQDCLGRSIEIIGTDSDALLNKCKAYALEQLSEQANSKK